MNYKFDQTDLFTVSLSQISSHGIPVMAYGAYWDFG